MEEGNNSVVFGDALKNSPFGKVILPASDFEAVVTRLKNALEIPELSDEESEVAAQNIGDKLLEMMETIPASLNQLATIATTAADAGLNEQQILQFTETVAKTGFAYKLPAELISSEIADLRTVFKQAQTTEGLKTVIDSFGFLEDRSGANISEVFRFTNKLGRATANFGLSAQQTGALAATQLNAGEDIEEGTRSIKAFLTRLKSADVQNADFKSALKSIGFDDPKTLKAQIKQDPQGTLVSVLEGIETSGDVDSTVARLVDDYSATSITTLVKNLESYKGNITSVDSTNRAQYQHQTERKYDNEAQTTRSQLQLVYNQENRLGVAVGEDHLNTTKSVLSLTGSAIGSAADAAESSSTLSDIIFYAVTAATIGQFVPFKKLGDKLTQWGRRKLARKAEGKDTGDIGSAFRDKASGYRNNKSTGNIVSKTESTTTETLNSSVNKTKKSKSRNRSNIETSFDRKSESTTDTKNSGRNIVTYRDSMSILSQFIGNGLDSSESQGAAIPAKKNSFMQLFIESGKKLGVVGTAVTGALSINSILNKDELSGSQKAAAVTKELGALGGASVGAMAGVALGAKAGAAVGTMLFPGVGTVIGAGLGLVGGAIGAVGGDMLGETLGNFFFSDEEKKTSASDTPKPIDQLSTANAVSTAVLASTVAATSVTAGTAPTANTAPQIINHNNYQISIQQQPGQDARALADDLIRELEHRQNLQQRGALFHA